MVVFGICYPVHSYQPLVAFEYLKCENLINLKQLHVTSGYHIEQYSRVDLLSNNIILVFIEKQDTKEYVQYDTILVKFQKLPISNTCSVESPRHQKYKSTCRNEIKALLGRKWKKRLEGSLVSSVIIYFQSRFETNMVNCSVPMVFQ